MIKICSQSLTLPLKIIFARSIKKGKFPEIWKKANVVPVYKREDTVLQITVGHRLLLNVYEPWSVKRNL